ncbi:hypothetical protein C8J57DRAFT_1577474 [Mycena rebaudengoi]|nr:hypothetical protein C8J57DRAFT_1577474 [Mycena rebaudengoi]
MTPRARPLVKPRRCLRQPPPTPHAPFDYVLHTRYPNMGYRDNPGERPRPQPYLHITKLAGRNNRQGGIANPMPRTQRATSRRNRAIVTNNPSPRKIHSEAGGPCAAYEPGVALGDRSECPHHYIAQPHSSRTSGVRVAANEAWKDYSRV